MTKFSVKILLVVVVLFLLTKLIIYAEIISNANFTTMRANTRKLNESSELDKEIQFDETYADIGLKTFVKRYEKLNVRIATPSSLERSNKNDDNNLVEEFVDDDYEEEKEEEDDVQLGDEEESFQHLGQGTFQLDALGEHFKVSYVHRSVPSIFTADASVTVIEDDGHQRRIDLKKATENYVEGHLFGDLFSHVYGDLSLGFFDGVIVTADESYYFEAADKYFRRPHRFNTVAYRASDVMMCPHGQSTSGSCSQDREPLTSSGKRLKTFHFKESVSKQKDYIEDEIADDKIEEADVEFHDLEKSKAASHGKQCHTMIVVDHTFMAGVARNSDKNAINEVNIHMIASDRIFKTTDFNGDEQPDGIGLKIVSLQVIKRKSGYPLAGVFSDPDSFLQKVAEYKLDNFCSGFVFTFRNMRGVLGASYLGVPTKGVDGGICATRRRYKEYGNKELNLNTGFASFKYADHDKVVPRGRSICTVAHEFGHLFGSPHDDTNKERECNPSQHEDKYLMATKRSVDARISKRNQQFSSCSCKHIKKYLKTKGQCLK